MVVVEEEAQEPYSASAHTQAQHAGGHAAYSLAVVVVVLRAHANVHVRDHVHECARADVHGLCH